MVHSAKPQSEDVTPNVSCVCVFFYDFLLPFMVCLRCLLYWDGTINTTLSDVSLTRVSTIISKLGTNFKMK